MEVIGDAARLRQVLLNLAGNAIKFTSTGGVALIVEPGIWPDEISFLVRDTGIGIAPEAQERIFREFEQADDRIARSYGGTGLGLSISERIVKRMGGRITLQSEPGAGSTFEVSIPLAAAEARQRTTGLRRAGSDRSIDHAGGAAEHRGLADRAAAAALGRPDLHGFGYRGGAGAAAGAVLARRADRPRARRRATSSVLGEAARRHATQRIVMFTPATRHELQPLRDLRLHRLSGQAAARRLAGGPPDAWRRKCPAPTLASDA